MAIRQEQVDRHHALAIASSEQHSQAARPGSGGA